MTQDGCRCCWVQAGGVSRRSACRWERYETRRYGLCIGRLGARIASSTSTGTRAVALYGSHKLLSVGERPQSIGLLCNYKKRGRRPPTHPRYAANATPNSHTITNSLSTSVFPTPSPSTPVPTAPSTPQLLWPRFPRPLPFHA